MTQGSHRFIVTTQGRNALDLRSLCERFVNSLWIPTELEPEQAANYALDYFRRTALEEIEMLAVVPIDDLE